MSDLEGEAGNHIELAQRDIELGFSDSFTPAGDGWRVVEAFLQEGAMSNGRCTSVPWEYACAHTGEFLGLPPTGDEFTIHGVTIVVEQEDEEVPQVFHRYIDWANVMAHLGLGATWRPTLTQIPGRG